MEGQRTAEGLFFTARYEGKAEGKAEGIVEGIKIGEASGEVKGKEKGKREQAEFSACKLKALGIDTATIAACTGLTEQEILELKCDGQG
jgi:hypothetical protein